VRAEEKLTAFLELESAIRAFGELVLTDWRVLCQTRRRQVDLNQAEDFPPLGFSASSRPLQSQNREAALVQVHSKF
jgi:hypothetical protein